MLEPRRLAQGVQLVDEDDTGALGFGLLEHIANARGADAHEHFDEVRSGQTEKRHAGLAGNGLGQQRLAGSRRSDQQQPLGNAAAEDLIFLGCAQELNDFAQFFHGLVNSGHVLERHAQIFLGIHFAAAASKCHGRAGAPRRRIM